MITVTPRDVVAIAPEFRSTLEGEASAGSISALVNVAKAYVNEGKWGPDKGKQGVALLTAHLMKELGFGDGSPVNHNGMVTSERIGDLSRTYSNGEIAGTSVLDQLFMTTQYGRQFILLKRTLGPSILVC